MKYHLDTIPVWDAVKAGSECPFCIIRENSEKSYVDSFLGGSVMEPDTRVAVNEQGFCAHHNRLLYRAQNRLGLALMTHTYTLKTLEKFDMKTAGLKREGAAAAGGLTSLINKILGKKTGLSAVLQQFSHWLGAQTASCILCDRINYSLNRYAYTLLHLYQHDDEFKETLLSSKGFCLVHFKTVLDMALETLTENKQAVLLSDLLPLQRSQLDRQEKELKWFTEKFDYRNQDKPWGNSKDALPRLLQKLTGTYIE